MSAADQVETQPCQTGQRLRKARRVRGLTQQDVADELGISRPVVVAIQQGTRVARPEELVRLARLYGRSLHELTRETPALSGLVGQFRLSAVHGRDADLTSHVEQLQRLAEDVVELLALTGTSLPRRYPEPYDIQGLSPDLAAGEVATSERQRLGLGDGPLPQLRQVLENDVGLLVFSVPLSSWVAGLVGYAEPAGGCMAINARHPHERQHWSLAHEYGHFLTNRYSPELTVLHGYLRVPAHERFAEAFAAHFLMPGNGLTRRFQNLRRARGGTLTPADLLQLANLYNVSVTALVLRLEALRLVTTGTWDALLERGFRVEEAKALVGLPSAPPDTDLLPLRHRYLAAEAYLDGTPSEGQLARLLRVDRLAARQLVHDLSQSADVGEDGDKLELGLDDGRVAS